MHNIRQNFFKAVFQLSFGPKKLCFNKSACTSGQDLGLNHIPAEPQKTLHSSSLRLNNAPHDKSTEIDIRFVGVFL